MPILKNTKQEAFCQARVAGKTLDESYRAAGYKPNRPAASRLATNGNVQRRIAELQQRALARAEVTIDTIAAELDEDRALAFKNDNPGAAVAATMGKAKLFGLLVERATVQVTHNYAMMSEEELRFELAAINAEARAIKPGMNH